MKPHEIAPYANALLMKVTVITGWQVPESDEFVRIINDQFQKKIMESYRDMNPDEIEYAIRTYGTQICDWGKSMNLSLIDQAIGSYLALRREISDYEEKLSKPRKEIAAAPADWSDEWERIKNAAKEGKEVIIPTAVYDWLDREGKIDLTNEEKKDLMIKAAEKLLSELKADIAENGSTVEKRNRLEMLQSGEYDNRVRGMIIRKAKTLVLNQLSKK